MSSIRDATSADTSRVVALDAVAAAGDGTRQVAIEHWIADGSMRVAVAADEIVGYCVTERAFFGHWFVVMLLVAEGARGPRHRCRATAGRTASTSRDQTVHLDEPVQPADAAPAGTPWLVLCRHRLRAR